MKDIIINQEDIVINIKEGELLLLIDEMISFIASYGLQEDLVDTLKYYYDIKLREDE